MADRKYKELARGKIKENRNVVISKVTAEDARGSMNEGYTIAQQVQIADGKRMMNVYLKNAFHIESLDGLLELRDALNVAIDREQKERVAIISEATNDDDDDWD